jgi:DNA polymerase delta subunit 1
MEVLLKKVKKNNDLILRPSPDQEKNETLTFINTKIENYEERLFVYGVTDNGNSVCAKVTDFRPYFFVEKSNNYDISQQRLETELKKQNKVKLTHPTYVISIEDVNYTKLMGYQSNGPIQMHKVTMSSPKYIVAARELFEDKGIPTHEASILYILRFMADKLFGGFEWLTFRNPQYTTKRETTCQIEAEVSHFNLSKDEDRSDVAKQVRIMGFDLEICKKGAGFAGHDVDPIIIISTETFNTQYQVLDVKLFALLPPHGGQITYENTECFTDERAMMLAWVNYICNTIDPDIFTGYNIDGYDWPYLFGRAEALGIKKEFSAFSRILDKSCYLRSKEFTSKASGGRKDYEAVVGGRYSYDMLKFAKAPANRIKLRSYTLNNVLQELLKKTKVEMPYDDIPEYFNNGTQAQRNHLCHYAWYDVEACRELMVNKMVMGSYVEQARVYGVPMEFLLNRGQQILTMSLLLRYCRKRGIAIPSYIESEEDIKTSGADVLTPLRGLHLDWVITLDFQSLYPSIMRELNLSYDTIVSLQWAQQNLKRSQYYIPPIPNCDFAFVTEDVRLGVLSEMQTTLFNLRNKIKADMKNEQDPVKRKVLDDRQNAVKLSMNSIYGFTGADTLSDKRIMEVVCKRGREMLELTKTLVESLFPGCSVIYGDTDSVFVKFPNTTMEQAFDLGQKAADACTNMFNEERRSQGKCDIHLLQREKGFQPFLLVGKKKYAGRKYMKVGDAPIFSCSGLENVRRDNALIGSETQEKALEMIIMQGDYNGTRAIQYVHEQISLLLHGHIPMSKLIISKNISKAIEKYEVNVPSHICLAKRVNERKHLTGETGYYVGDRVKYVLTCGLPNSKIRDRVEDPMYAMQNRIPLDYNYYIYNQMMKPLLRIFTSILSPEIKLNTMKGWKDAEKQDIKKVNRKGATVDKNVKDIKQLQSYKVLFTGVHMHQIVQKSHNSYGITKHVTKMNRCLVCNIGNETSVCDNCSKYRPSVIANLQSERRYLETKQWECWTTCQRCVGNLHNPVMCGNRDCDNFYERQKVLFDIEDLDKKKV